jgi:hypothetical protein
MAKKKDIGERRKELERKLEILKVKEEKQKLDERLRGLRKA